MSIQKAVGQNSPNIYSDVLRIQALLNQARKTYPRFGTSVETLAEDGNCGSKTIAAIKGFQGQVMQFGSSDGVVEPNRNTWKKLNGNSVNKTAITFSPVFQKPSINNFIQWFTGQGNGNLEEIYSQFQSDTNQRLGIANTLLPASPVEKRQVATFSQVDSRWGSSKLGNGSGAKAVFSACGCAVVSLTMAATYLGSPKKFWPKGLKPNQLDPLKVNTIFKKAGVYGKTSFTITITSGAQALGMKAADTGSAGRLSSMHLQTIDDCLRNSGLVMVNVDYKGDSSGDHWVLITEKLATGEYSAIDPAYGKQITFSKTPSSGTASKSVILYGKPQTSARKAGSYKVVRMVTLFAS